MNRSPSDKDVFLEIQNIELFFNTSKDTNNKDSDFKNACEAVGGPTNKTAVCVVDQGEGRNGKPDDNAASRVGWWGAGVAVGLFWGCVVVAGWGGVWL